MENLAIEDQALAPQNLADDGHGFAHA